MYGAAIPPTLAHIDEKPTPMVLFKKRKRNDFEIIKNAHAIFLIVVDSNLSCNSMLEVKGEGVLRLRADPDLRPPSLPVIKWRKVCCYCS